MIGIDNKSHIEYAHRLVAKVYIPNPNNYPIVNHKDGNPSNNNVENLEWCTQSFNSQHSINLGRRKTKSVVKKDKNGRILGNFPSIASAARSVEVSSSAISSACRKIGRVKYIKGFIWEFA